ncbi:Ig-specific serine endopeptidase MIP [Mycoplasma enhydrae]|uniref:Ig-specific serine endopeptidase MIP n=1 Tax=Mycoplasma enhydrae TaxID=2499220 RepID=UPI00197C6C59|nr:DUF31 family protein [Mycoplasma enhydrae]MBN4089551.1 DUF31 family protein [Mycoplasma enhydrae]MCV3733528.1 DUF31 family protein [Mycoplasma enhydrae]
MNLKTKKTKLLLSSLLGISAISIPLLTLISCVDKTKNKKEEDNNKDNNKDNESKKDDNNKTPEKDNDTPDPNLKYPNNEFEADINKIKENNDLDTYFEFSFNLSAGSHNKNQIFASELQRDVLHIQLRFKDNDLDKKIATRPLRVILENNANQTGNAKIVLELINKDTNKTEKVTFVITGLATNPLNVDNEGKKPNEGFNQSKTELEKYFEKSQKERFEFDNNKYMSGLKNYLSQQGFNSIKDLRPNLNITQAQKSQYNELAAKLGQESYDNAATKGFSLPSYKPSGEIDGLEIKDGAEMPKKSSWFDETFLSSNPNQIDGLARVIVNEHYLRMAMQTFSIQLSNYKDFKEEITKAQKSIEYWKDPKNEAEFAQLIANKVAQLEAQKAAVTKQWDEKIAKNKDPNLDLVKLKEEELAKYDKEIAFFKNHSRAEEIKILTKKIEEYQKRADAKKESTIEAGTMWILDYQIDESKKDDPNWYPTKWYFGTNSHVAKAITNNLSGFSITKVRPDIQVGQKLRISQMDDNIVTYSFNNTNAIRKVFDGIDYLSSKPSEYLTSAQATKLSDVEEFADFAVIEIDFSKINDYFALSNSKAEQSIEKTAEFFTKLSKLMTNDYANPQNQKNHIKLRSKSYLHDYDAIDFTKSKSKAPEDSLYIMGWPSSRQDYFLKPYIDDDQRQNESRNHNNYSLWINSQSNYYDAKIGDPSYPKSKLDRGEWLSYQLGYRSFIDKPGILDTFINVPKLGQDFYYVDGKRYVNMALAYSPRRYAPIGGASGSSVRNQKNELVSVFYGSNSAAKAGLSVALRSEGFDYQGLYGKYNLPQYDLIYGGGKIQKNSYRQALAKLYSQNIKTNLFKQGLKDEFIPEEFKFQ